MFGSYFLDVYEKILDDVLIFVFFLLKEDMLYLKEDFVVLWFCVFVKYMKVFGFL